MRLVFATNNKHKIREISELLGDNIELLSLEDVNIHCEIPEDYNTLEENAMAKARYIHKITGMDVFADDTGLEIDALNGAPGVFSARFAGEEKILKKILIKFLN